MILNLNVGRPCASANNPNCFTYGPMINTVAAGIVQLTKPLILNQWQHVVFRYSNSNDQSSSSMGLYVDCQGAEWTYSIPNNIYYNQNYFGAFRGGLNPNSEFDDAKIFSRALTDAEVCCLANDKPPSIEAPFSG